MSRSKHSRDLFKNWESWWFLKVRTVSGVQAETHGYKMQMNVCLGTSDEQGLVPAFPFSLPLDYRKACIFMTIPYFGSFLPLENSKCCILEQPLQAVG